MVVVVLYQPGKKEGDTTDCGQASVAGPDEVEGGGMMRGAVSEA